MFTLKPGKYWIGDPCYIFENHNEWKTVRAMLSYPSCIINYDSTLIPVFSTRDGDGLYPVLIGDAEVGRFAVDSGMYAIFPEEFLTNRNTLDRIGRLGVFLEINRSVDLTYSNGDTTMGHTGMILTSKDPFANEEEEWAEEEAESFDYCANCGAVLDDDDVEVCDDCLYGEHDHHEHHKWDE